MGDVSLDGRDSRGAFFKMSKSIANPNLPSPPSGKYPAKSHCRRVAKWIADNGGPKSGVLYLEGQSTKMTEVKTLQPRESELSADTVAVSG